MKYELKSVVQIAEEGVPNRWMDHHVIELNGKPHAMLPTDEWDVYDAVELDPALIDPLKEEEYHDLCMDRYRIPVSRKNAVRVSGEIVWPDSSKGPPNTDPSTF